MWFEPCTQAPPSFPSLAVQLKRERAWYLFSRERRQDRKDGRKGLIVCGHTGLRTAKELLKYLVNYHTYLTSGRRLSYTPSIECVVG